MQPFSARVVHQSFLPENARSFVWKYSLDYGGRRPRHFHAEPELNLVVRGSAVFGVGDAVIRVAAGELIGFPAGQDHVLLETTPDVYLYAVGMDPAFAGEALRGPLGAAALPLHVRLPTSELCSVARWAGEIVDQSGVEQRCAELWERVHWLGRRSAAGYSGAMHVLTRRALLEVAQEPEIGLEPLAGKLRASASEVSRYFHRDMGMTFVRFRRRQRLLRFIGLVEKGNANWLACANAAGFGSYSQCHRTLQADLGCSPREFFGAGLRDRMQQLYED